MEQCCDVCGCGHSGNGLVWILRHDRVQILGMNLSGTVLFADGEWAYVALDTGYDVPFDIDQLRLMKH